MSVIPALFLRSEPALPAAPRRPTAVSASVSASASASAESGDASAADGGSEGSRGSGGGSPYREFVSVSQLFAALLQELCAVLGKGNGRGARPGREGAGRLLVLQVRFWPFLSGHFLAIFFIF